MSLYVLFDIGNTRLKWAAVESHQNPIDRNKKLWLYSGAIDTKLLHSPEHCAELAHYITQTVPRPDTIAVCCVADEACVTNLKRLLPQWDDVPWARLTGHSPFAQLRSSYEDPRQLGGDRWAGVIAARTLSNANSLIVNSGTATTIDFLGANGLHHGGWIIPGLGLMQSSLNTNTARLPSTAEATGINGFGLSTEAAIYKGCLAAQVGVIQSALHLAAEMHQPVERVWIDGGNAKHLAAELKQNSAFHSISIEAINGLVLRGLWAWLLQQQ